MNFRNLAIYCLSDFTLTGAALEELLSKHPLQPCSGLSTTSRGFVSPRGDKQLVYSQGRQMLIALGVNSKKLPASAVKKAVIEAAESLEKQQGFAVGKKQKREIAERIITEMLPQVIASYRMTRAYIDTVKGLLIVDSPSAGRAEEVTEYLRNVVGMLTLTLPTTKLSPAALMTAWLSTGESSSSFEIGNDCELRGSSAEKETIKYARCDLLTDDVKHHFIKDGKTVRKLELMWKERVSFVLTDTLQLKRFTYLDLDRQRAQQSEQVDAELQFETDFAIFVGTVTSLVPSLFAAHGGLEQ